MLEYEFKNLVSNQNQSNNENKTKKKKTTFSPGGYYQPGLKVAGSWHVRRHL
jgi:hypothetical protein